MGNYFSSNKVADESLQNSIINENKEETPQDDTKVDNSSAIPKEVVEEINDYFKDPSDNLVSNQDISTVNEVTGINCEAVQTIEEKNEIVVAEESEKSAEELSNKPTQLQLPTKKQKKKKHKQH